ncbi:MAG: glycosyltransferase family 2 protein [Holophagales bacterium]|nr:glycosyltransferase family 2 protein [Holophagales bacterium]
MTEGVLPDPRVSAAAVSVVIPAHHADEGFRACLASVASCRPPAGEVIVVVDGEAPGCTALAAAAGARVLVTNGGEGPAVARNRGAREAAGAVVLFLDADVVAPSDLMDRVAAAFDQDPRLDGHLRFLRRRSRGPGVVSVFRNLLHHHVHQTSQPEASSFWSGCGALRTSVLGASGGFDERYARPSVEDIELGSRLVRAGRRIRLDRSLQVKHLKRWSLWGMVVTDVRDRALPWTELILAERRLPRDLNLRPGHRVSTAAALTLVAGLVAIPFWPLLGLLLAAPALVALLAANVPFYRRLVTLRGPAFLVAAIPLHGLHYLCGALGFGAGLARHALSAGRPFPSREADHVAASAGPEPFPGARIETAELAPARIAGEP